MSLFVFLAAFGFYLSGASASIAARDCADMSSAALTLGVAHSPGYPLYSALGHLWLTLFPLGDPAYRLAVMSCLAAAGAAALLFSAVRRRAGLASSLTAAFLFVCCFPLWKFALIQEKYALHALFAAGLFHLADGEAASFWRRARLSGLIAGLGLVNHQSLLLVLPGLYLAWGSDRRRFARAAAPWLFAGLSLYAFLWIRLGSLPEALAVALRAQYGAGTLSAGLARPFSPERAWALFTWSLEAAAAAVGLVAVFLAVAGAFAAKDRSRTGGLLLSAFGAGPLFIMLSRFDTSSWVARSVLEPAFLIPALALTALAGEGLALVERRRPALAACVGLLFAAGTATTLSPLPVRRDDFLAHDYVRNLRRAVPPGASLLVSGDTALFGLRWLEATAPRAAPLELAGAGLVEPRRWLAERSGRTAFVAGLAPGVLPAAALSPEGLVQRMGPPGVSAPVILRRSSSWNLGESYARDARLTYAFAAWSSARLLEARGVTPPETLDLTAVSLDPEDYRLE